MCAHTDTHTHILQTRLVCLTRLQILVFWECVSYGGHKCRLFFVHRDRYTAFEKQSFLRQSTGSGLEWQVQNPHWVGINFWTYELVLESNLLKKIHTSLIQILLNVLLCSTFLSMSMCTLKYILHSTNKSKQRTCFQLKNCFFPPTTKKWLKSRPTMTQNTDQDFSRGVLHTLKSWHKPPLMIKETLGLAVRINEWKKHCWSFAIQKIVKETKNEGKENDQRCKGERGEY